MMVLAAGLDVADEHVCNDKAEDLHHCLVCVSLSCLVVLMNPNGSCTY